MTSKALIAIIGAGPAGLTLARLLQISNIDYIVFDRDESSAWADDNPSSGTLDIHSDSGQIALQDAGLLGQFQQIARYGVSNVIADAQGKSHADLSGEGDKDKPEIDRKDLRRLLLNSVPTSKFRWGCKVQQVQKDADDSVSVHLTNGCVHSGFRLVVGADGAWSKVRNLITPAEPKYSGIHFLTTYVKPANPIYSSAMTMAGKGNYLAMGDKRQIFLHYLGDGSYHLSVGLRLAEESITAGTILKDPSALWHSLLQDEFATWAPELTGLAKHCDGNFRSWPFYSMSTESLPREHVPGVVLVGDAAHLTVPGGDGVNNAMLDSLELARQIVKHGVDGLDSAVVDYEKVMLPRAVASIQKGQWFAENFFGASSPGSFLQALGLGG